MKCCTCRWRKRKRRKEWIIVNKREKCMYEYVCVKKKFPLHTNMLKMIFFFLLKKWGEEERKGERIKCYNRDEGKIVSWKKTRVCKKKKKNFPHTQRTLLRWFFFCLRKRKKKEPITVRSLPSSPNSLSLHLATKLINEKFEIYRINK